MWAHYENPSRAFRPPFAALPVSDANKTRYHLPHRATRRENPMSQPKAPSPWRIIDPVRPQIRRAMAIATAAAVLSTA